MTESTYVDSENHVGFHKHFVKDGRMKNWKMLVACLFVLVLGNISYAYTTAECVQRRSELDDRYADIKFDHDAMFNRIDAFLSQHDANRLASNNGADITDSATSSDYDYCSGKEEIWAGPHWTYDNNRNNVYITEAGYYSQHFQISPNIAWGHLDNMEAALDWMESAAASFPAQYTMTVAEDAAYAVAFWISQNL
jgi:hypothetical protein